MKDIQLVLTKKLSQRPKAKLNGKDQKIQKTKILTKFKWKGYKMRQIKYKILINKL